MARGVRKTTAEMLAEVDAKIQKKQAELEALKNRHREIETAQQAKLAAKVLQAAEKKGVSIEELLETIEKKK